MKKNALIPVLATIAFTSCGALGLQPKNKDAKEALQTSNLALAASLLALAQSTSTVFPAAQVLKSTQTTLANGSTDFIFFNYATYDTGGFFSLTAPDRVTVPSDGVYFVQGWLTYAANPTGERKIIIYLNTDAIGSTGSILTEVLSPAAAGDMTVLAADTVLRCVKGDYLKLRAYQNSGGNLNLLVSGYSQVLYIRKLTN